MRALLAFVLMSLGWVPPAGAQPAVETGEMALEQRLALADAFQRAGGQERILAFSSDVTVMRSGDLDVTETIRVVALADQIKHGIFRDFPTSYRNRLGQTTRVGFELVSVARDGKPELYAEEGLSNGVRVRIGSADVRLPPGEHVYAIRYRTSRQIVYLAEQDEVYWNVTGNGWPFPIDMAEVRIALPSPASFGNRWAYTGPQGSEARDAAVVGEGAGFIHFRTTAPLDAYSGLTVAAAFPKGVLDAPSRARKARWWLEDWGALAAAGLALCGLFLFYFYAWLKAGRGPRKGSLVPLFSPPDGLSAAACRYISRMKADDRGFTAAIVDLAVRGHVGITKEDGGWFARDTTRLDRRAGDGPAPAPEMAMCSAMLPGIGSSIELKQANHSKLQAARRALNVGLEKAYLGTFFVKNASWAFAGLLGIGAAILLVATVAILVQPQAHNSEMARMPLYGLLAVGAMAVCNRLTRHGTLLAILAWLGMGVALLIAFFATAISLQLAIDGAGWAIFVPLAALPLGLSAFMWMYAPTVEGRAMMDRIAGFRHYLGITEEERLEALHPPEKTPELFERYLPYAIALDVENRWADKFATILAAAAAAGTAAHTASWYSGDSSFWNDPDGFANSVGSSLASTISSASASPSSSSGGSSGGGSSGGGGGGGGGGGW